MYNRINVKFYYLALAGIAGRMDICQSTCLKEMLFITLFKSG